MVADEPGSPSVLQPLRLEVESSSSLSSLLDENSAHDSPGRPSYLLLPQQQHSGWQHHAWQPLALTAAFASVFAACLYLAISATKSRGAFYAAQDRFWFSRSGEPARQIRLLSGEIHYFRIVPEYWKDRLQRVKSMGLNAVQIYIPWNWHCQLPGKCSWTGSKDVVKFITLAHQLGLFVLVRPGPYICAEWDFGGLPWWLAAPHIPGSPTGGGEVMRLRSNDTLYINQVQRYWDELLPKLQPLLIQNGGPIIMLQLENELGFFAEPTGKEVAMAYLRKLAQIARQHLGPSLLLYTSDPVWKVDWGSLPGEEVLTYGPLHTNSCMSDWGMLREGNCWR